jgi:aryl-alcohol dehydrogenase-like predicted oxidoreductase
MSHASAYAPSQCLAPGTEGLGTVTNKPAHIAAYIEGTRERLGFYPDLYYLHRIDPDTPLEESIPALEALKTAGKCRYIGLSEPSAATLRKACASEYDPNLQLP